MIIRGWEIDGFGAFRDQRSPDLGDGLSVLHGPNEAGKSTLLAFIRGVLFGFPDKRSKGKQPLYEPPGGGAFGGSVIVEHDGRAYRIHRRAGSRNNRPAITDAHGQSVPEGELPQILGGADETLFKNVFGFSLSELQEGESLTDEGVRDRIFSNAVAGAGRDARKAAEELEGQAKALYSPNARQKRNRAAQLLDEIKQVDQQLAEARAAVRDYPNKLEAERAAAEEKARLDHDIAHWRTRRQELDALLRLWEPWCARARALETLEQLTGRSLPRVEPVRGDAALDAQQRQVDALRESLGLQRQRLLDAGEQANQLQAEDARIAHTLETLGPAWTEQRVEAFSLPIPAREEVRAWQRALDGAETDVAKAEEQRAEAERRRRESAERHEKLARDLENVSDPPPKLETLQQRQGDLEDLRAKAAELARLRDTEGYARTAAQAAEARLDELRAGQPGRAATLGAIGAAALAVAAALGAALLGDLAAAGALAVLAVVLAGAFAGLRRRARKNAAEIERARDDRDTKREDADQQAAWLRALEQEVAAAARALGLQDLPGEGDLARAATDLGHQLESRRRLDRQIEAVEEQRQDVEKRQQEVADRVQALETAKAGRQRPQEDWAAWKRDRDFPDEVSPEGVLDFAEQLRQAQETLQQKRALERKLDQLRAAIAGWEDSARSIVRARAAATAGMAATRRRPARR